MQKQKIVLHRMKNDCVRTVIKTKHGRLIYLELSVNADKFAVKECFYLDRERGGKYYAVPQKFVTRKFEIAELLNVVATELDREYYGAEYTDESLELSKDAFIEKEKRNLQRGYKFLIFVGDGELIGGIPSKLATRLANRLHRKIYLKISYLKEGIGVIEDCCYFDRKYKAKTKVIPPMLTSVFVAYDRKTILETINRELDCDFTDIIITDGSIDIEKNAIAICGNI